MKPKEHLAVGHLKKSRGRKGALRFHIEDKYMDLIGDPDHFFLEIEGQYIPYFIRSIQKGNPKLIRFDSISTPEMAKKIAGAALYVRVDPEADGTDLPQDEEQLLQGFTALDERGATIGTIKEIRELPQQLMAVVMIDGQERYIPLHPDLILGIDEEEESIQFDLPEGMLEL